MDRSGIAKTLWLADKVTIVQLHCTLESANSRYSLLTAVIVTPEANPAAIARNLLSGSMFLKTAHSRTDPNVNKREPHALQYTISYILNTVLKFHCSKTSLIITNE